MPSGEQRSGDQHGKSPTNEQGQPDKVPPTDGLPKNKGGEEDGDQHAQLVDGDHHAGGTILEGPVVAEPRGTGGSPGGQDEAELPTRRSTNLPKFSGDGDHHPGWHQDHPDVDHDTEYGLPLVVPALSKIPVNAAKKAEPSTQSSQRRHRLSTDASQHARRASAFSSTV